MSTFLYDYWPIVDRPPVWWPDGKRLAVYIALNIEHFEPGRPSTAITPLTAGLPVDPLNTGWRDYGLRVGIWRMIELLDRHGLRASALVNSEVLERYPQIVRAGLERGWSWVAHGVSNSRLWTGLELDQERAALTAIADELRRHTGRAPMGWLGPALTETAHTCELLAELGFSYTLDWCADDQPFPLRAGAGRRFISVPYSIEVNDITSVLSVGATGPQFGQLIIDHFDLLHEESQRRPGAVAAIGLHPFIANQTVRHRYLAQALEHICGHDDVWLTTADEIAAHYLEHHYAAAAAAQPGAAP